MVKEIVYNDFLTYCRGVDSSTEDVQGMAVTAELPDPAAVASEVTYTTSVVQSQSKFEETLGVSAAMSIKYGLVASGSANVKYTSNNALSENSLAIVCSVKIKNLSQLVKNVTLTQPAKDLYTRDPAKFAEVYGDMYVAGLITGGELYGVLQIHSRDSTQKQSFRMELSARAGIGLAKIEASMEYDKTSSTELKSAESEMFVYTSGLAIVEPGNQQELLDAAKTYADKVATTGHAMPTIALLMDYKYLADLPEGPNPWDEMNRSDVIAFAADVKAQALYRLATIKDIRKALNKDPALYPTANDAELAKSEEEVLKLLDTLYKTMSDCYNDYRKCKFAQEPLTLPPWEPPKPRKVEVEAPSAITEKYKLCSFLGDAVSEEKTCADGIGKYREFQKGRDLLGVIFWHPNYGANYVTGLIRSEYYNKNYERGPLGYPVEDEKASGTSYYSHFERGVLILDSDTNKVRISMCPVPGDGQIWPHFDSQSLTWKFGFQ